MGTYLSAEHVNPFAIRELKLLYFFVILFLTFAY
jgi:hypothetical protein